MKRLLLALLAVLTGLAIGAPPVPAAIEMRSEASASAASVRCADEALQLPGGARATPVHRAAPILDAGRCAAAIERFVAIYLKADRAHE